MGLVMQNIISIGKTETGEDISIDLERLLETRALLTASSGGGKSYTLRKTIEESYGKVQIVVIDVEGEFSTLREKFDFLLIGNKAQGADIQADVKTAELLAKKIMELRISAIIDLYELKHHERIRFVKLFLDSMINAPKELWHPVMLVIDEIHNFCPEKGKGEAESSTAVIDIATRGRKRGIGLIGATQRISKFNKDAAAELLNKIIGLTNLDVDRKRAADEIGFTNKEDIRSLRDMETGHFYFIGSAISKVLVKGKIGAVQTSHPKIGQRNVEVPKMTENIKKILSKLTDLPQEAEKELKDKQDMMRHIRELEAEIRKKPIHVDTKHVDKYKLLVDELNRRGADISKELQKQKSVNLKLVSSLEQIGKLAGQIVIIEKTYQSTPISHPLEEKTVKWNPIIPKSEPSQQAEPLADTMSLTEPTEPTFGRCERSILKFLALREGKSFTKTQIGAMTNYSANSGGFNNALSKLKIAGLIRASGNSITINSEEINQVIEILGDEYNAPEQNALESWLNRLGLCPKKIYQILLEHPAESFTKEQLGEMTGYSANSGGFNNALSNLCTLGLAVRSGGQIALNQELLGV